jgi:hypothetical protein
MRLVTLLAVLLLGLGVAGHARADDQASSASQFLARHGLSSQVAQLTGCATKCVLPESEGGNVCKLPVGPCMPAGAGCTCPVSTGVRGGIVQ